jgi:LytS/YehU family sensor histidine kinase
MRNSFVEKTNRLTNEKNLIELKNKAFSSQMNPHFVYNSLSAAQYLVMINENKKAFNYLSDFSLLLRQMFENAKKSFITLNEEISFVNRYIDLERLRFNYGFTCEIDTKKLDPTRTYYVPTMMIQPIVENAIRHGLAPKKTGGELKISFFVENELLLCIIDDNGIGLKKDLQNIPNQKSTALGIINERIQLINQTSEKAGYLSIKDKRKAGSEGVTVVLGLPIQNN